MDLQTVRDFALTQLENAKEFSRRIIVENSTVQRKAMRAKRSNEIWASIADDPEFDSLCIGDGIGAWTSIAAIDLRGSTDLAESIGARNTYLMTHTLLPTLAYVCEQLGGHVMNLRGDGLFASFGLKKLSEYDDEPPSDEKIEKANGKAVGCGLALLQATNEAVQPVLNDEGIDVDLSVGVGVDCGNVIVTRVGWRTAQELTAYGPPVNRACKISDGDNLVRVSRNVQRKFPCGPDGTLEFDLDGDAYVASFPTPMLDR